MTKARAASRRDQAVTALAAPMLATKPLSRACPKCEAQPWKPCRRWNAGGGYWRTLKKVHDERRQRRNPTQTVA